MSTFGTIGIIGQGFVGNAVATGFKDVAKMSVATYDKIPQKTTHNLDWIATNCKIIFVCVPTPMLDSGACDTSIVESVIDDINMKCYAANLSHKPIVVIKSTVIPGTCDRLAKKYTNIDITFNPEFLNARSAVHDFLNQDHIVLGGDKAHTYQLADLFYQMLPYAKMVHCSRLEAETVKYVKNTFFATKVSFANEMYQICQKLGVDYDNMISIAKLDDRMGWEHWKVPGPTLGDGPWTGKQMFGFGGVCLSKDIQSFQQLAIELDIDAKMLKAAWQKNLEVRPERDWEYLPGAMTNVKK